MLLQEGALLGDQRTYSPPALLGRSTKSGAWFWSHRDRVGPGNGRRRQSCDKDLGVTWMRCTVDGRAWLEQDWSRAWDLGVGAKLLRKSPEPLLGPWRQPMGTPARLTLKVRPTWQWVTGKGRVTPHATTPGHPDLTPDPNTSLHTCLCPQAGAPLVCRGPGSLLPARQPGATRQPARGPEGG